MKKIILFVPIIIMLQSCTVALKDYSANNLENREVVYSELRGDAIKIYLRNKDKFDMEQRSNHLIFASEYCNVRGGTRMSFMDMWKVTEEEAFTLASENSSPILFVCSAEEADFIYEYTYKVSEDIKLLDALSVPLSVGTIGMIPLLKNPRYEVSIVVKNKQNTILFELNPVVFSHKTVSSIFLLPFSVFIKDKPVPTEIVPEIIMDQIIGSLYQLNQYNK